MTARLMSLALTLSGLEIDALFGQIADEAAGETVARAGGIENLFEQIAGNHEVRVAMEQNGAVFAALDHQRLGAHRHDLGGRAPEVVFARKHAALRCR